MEQWTITVTFEDDTTATTTCSALYQLGQAIMDLVNIQQHGHGSIMKIEAV